MSTPIQITVLLYLHEGQRNNFEQYERSVKPIIEQFGGRFLAIGMPVQTIGFEPAPDEVHWLTFPTQEDFDAYRKRPVSAELLALRKRAISRTLLIQTVPSSYM